ncbi:hypothetical protein QWY75_04375 [Pontixanthobacter aestiaquae]|uniref:Uncharacterized protein n=1 Tax=Pontixanthobacter aestiaquae TaxID=1509367 RepID=A0A844Z8K7_9SPHN|nr:hypothetical protein [Pontixanthobacter aestiaquae]MDN3645444.1 hypothetical protein [Pontixanthobacter aestiaquae]MXO83556.1 hypothetical protein [Pontixanthobacter aestiaquae]
MLRASAIWAVIGGVLLATLEVRANWGDWQWWPWWLVDFVAAGFLLIGGIRTLRGDLDGRLWLVAAWAFAFGMGWMSLAGNIEIGPDPNRDARLGGGYIALVSFGVVSSLIALLLALFGRPKT